MLKKIIDSLIPPIFISLHRKVFSNEGNPNILFDGEDGLFKRVLKQANRYGEYGCGKSTKWVLNNTSSDVIAVDTSQQWVDEVVADNKVNNERLVIKHVDLSAVGNWGNLSTSASAIASVNIPTLCGNKTQNLMLCLLMGALESVVFNVSEVR